MEDYEAYIPKYQDALGANWNCRRLYRLWQFTLKLERTWASARRLKRQWHHKMLPIIRSHAAQQERALTVWVHKYKPTEDWLDNPTKL